MELDDALNYTFLQVCCIPSLIFRPSFQLNRLMFVTSGV